MEKKGSLYPKFEKRRLITDCFRDILRQAVDKMNNQETIRNLIGEWIPQQNETARKLEMTLSGLNQMLSGASLFPLTRFLRFSVLLLSVLFLWGCHGLDTHNVTVSTSIRKVATGKEKIDLMSRYGLICVFTDEVSPTQFFLRDKQNNTTSTATIDKGAFAAFFCMPGTYYFQKRSWVKLAAGSVLFLHTNRNSTNRIYHFPNSSFLTKKIEGDGINIIPADVLIPDLCGTAYRIGYYSTKAVINTILSPLYIIWGTSFMLNNIAHKAMNDSGDPRFMIGGALVYFLTLWSAVIMDRPGALCYSGEIGAPSSVPVTSSPPPADVTPPPTYLVSSPIETEPKFRKKSNFASPPAFMASPVIRENVFGPGIHQNQFGQPVKYHVPNWPANEPTQFLQVKPNVYGPGIGQDQFGRPVTTRPAF